MKVLLIAMAVVLAGCSRGRHNGRIKVDTVIYNYNTAQDTNVHNADTVLPAK